jgi:para-nitrobenzyl esterase
MLSARVELPFGVVHGNLLPHLNISEFAGIDYATAARWRTSVDWNAPYPSGSIDAKGYGPSCPQQSGQVYNASYADEACLSLNVWAPSSQATPRATLVFIHGGGLEFGGSSVFNGSVLASRQDVVVVSLNYRLGYLGFMAFEEDSAAGNSTGNW